MAGLKPGANNCLVVVQCRFSSTRLPGKALYPIAGLPMLAFLLRRLKSSLDSRRFRIVVAASTDREDDILEPWAKAEGCGFFRGPLCDVLGRYLGCLRRYPANTVVRVTADNPFTCPRTLAKLSNCLEEGEYDYAIASGLPIGATADVFSSASLRRIWNARPDSGEREHINLRILRHPEKFRALKLPVAGRLVRPELRLTVDTLQDWLRVSSIPRPEDRKPWNLPLGKVIERLDS